ncbi:MAG: PilZ domain-containing protein [Deltaproteobacteria bacterium]|jgi:Tfp pilus assembly protein PilZ|nr:PilZ domain-containing protein [Deltaproteobacteria bacterium]
MKCFLLADNRPDLLATLEPILKHWGYRVVSATNAQQATALLAESSLSLLIFGQKIFADKSFALNKAIQEQITSSQLPLIILKQNSDHPLPVEPNAILDVPVDIFALFAFIQRYVEKHPRQNLRLQLRLPGMYRVGNDEYTLSDVLSLSTKGLFFKTPMRLRKGDNVTVVFPLYGHCKELEIESKVLYVIQPEPSNNFMQGFGVGFQGLSAAEEANLEKFIEEHFLREVSSSQAGVGDFSENQLKR